MERRKPGTFSITAVIFILCAATETGAVFFFLPEAYYPFFHHYPSTTTTTTTTTTPAPTTKKYHPHGGYEYHLPPGDSHHNSGPWDHGGTVWLEDYPGYHHTTPPPPTTTMPPPTTTPAPTKPPKSYGHHPEEYSPYESHGPPPSHYGGYFHQSDPWESEIWDDEYGGYPPVTKPPPTTPKPTTTTPPPPTTPAPTKPSYKYIYPRIRYNPYHSHKGYGPPPSYHRPPPSYHTPPPPTTTPPPPPTTPPPPPPTTLEYPYPPVDDYPPHPPPPKFRKYPPKRPPPDYNHYSPYPRRPKGHPGYPPSDDESYGDKPMEHQSPKPTRIPVPPPPWLAKDKAPKQMPEDDYESDTPPPGYDPSSNADDYEDQGYGTDKPPPAAPPASQKKRKYPSGHGNSYSIRGKPVYSDTPPTTTTAPVSTPRSYSRPLWQYRKKNKQPSPSYSLTTPSAPIQTTLSPYLLPPKQSYNPPPYSHHHYQPIAAIPIYTYNQNGSQVFVPSHPFQLSYNHSLPTSAPPPSTTPVPQATTTPQPVYQHNPYPILLNYPSYLPAPTNAPTVYSTPKTRYVLPQVYGTPEPVASSLRNLTSGIYIPRQVQHSSKENPPALPQSSYVLPQHYFAPSGANYPSPAPPFQYQLQFYSLPQPTSTTKKPSLPQPSFLPYGYYISPQQLPLSSHPYQNFLPHVPEYIPPKPSSSPPSSKEPPSPTPSSQYLPPQLYLTTSATPKPPSPQFRYLPSQLDPHQQDYLPPNTYSIPQTTKIPPFSSHYLPPQQYNPQPIAPTTQKPPPPPPSQFRYLPPQPNTPPPSYIPLYQYKPATTTQKSPLPPLSIQYIPPITTSTPNPYSPFSSPTKSLPPSVYLPPNSATTSNPSPPRPLGKYLPPPTPSSPPPQNQYFHRTNIAQQYLPPNSYKSPPTTKKSPSLTSLNQYLPPQKVYTTPPTTSTTSVPSSTPPPPQNQYLPPLVTKSPIIPSSFKYLPPDSYKSLVEPISTKEPQPVAPPKDQYIPYLRSPPAPSPQLPYSCNVTSTDTSSQILSPESLQPMKMLASSNQSLPVQPNNVDSDRSAPSAEPISRYLLPPLETIIPSGTEKNISETDGKEGVNLNIQRSKEYEIQYQQSAVQNESQIPFQPSQSLSDTSSRDSQTIGTMGMENVSMQDSAKSTAVKRSTFQHGVIQKEKDLEVYESHHQPKEDSAKSTFHEPQEDTLSSHYPPSKIPARPIPPLVTYNYEGHVPPYPSRVNAEDKEPYEEEKIRNLKDSLSYPGIEKSGVRALSYHAIHYLASAAQAFSATARPYQEKE